MPTDPGYRHIMESWLARIYTRAGETDKAITLLEGLTAPGQFTPAWLRIDPDFAPLRGNPRFERLIAQAH